MSRTYPNSDRLVSLAVALIVLAAILGIAAGTPAGSPVVEVTLPANDVAPGEVTTLEVQVSNDAELSSASTTNPALNELVRTADGVRLELRSGGTPITVRTGERAVGSLPDGTARTVPFEVAVDGDAEPGRYNVPFELTYSHVRSVSESNGAVDEQSVTVDGYLGVRIEERARLAVVNASTDVHAGGTGTATLTVENVGSAPAREARIALRSPNADLGFGGTSEASRFLGLLEPGERRTVSYTVTASERARPAEYTAEAIGTFEDDLGRTVTTDPLPVGLAPREGRRFVVVSTESEAAVGGIGAVTVRLRNAGSETATDVSVSLRSPSPAIGVDGGPAASRYLERWEPGEERTLAFDVAANVTAAPGSHAFEGNVAFDTTQGVRSRVGSLTVPIRIRPELAFATADVESDLRVGREGTLHGMVRNRGNRTARNAVVVVESTSPNVRFDESTYPIGDLEPGAGGNFTFDARVPASAEPGPRAFSLRVRYEDEAGDARVSDGLDLRESVGPEPDVLELRAVNATFRVDSDNRLTVAVTNTGGGTLEDVEARLAVDSPFTSEAPSSFVEELEPGETTRVAFELTVSEDAVASTHAVAVNVTAETGSGETVRVGPTLLPVTVAEEPPGTGQVGTLVAGVVVVAVLLGSGYWWLRR
jgi:hypothetical protein